MQLLLVELLQRPLESTTYASQDYQAVLTAYGITCSMSRRGNCYDNSVMEAFFSTLKSEVGERFPSHAEAKAELFDYIEVFYNQSSALLSRSDEPGGLRTHDDSRSVAKPSTGSDQAHRRGL